MLSTCEAPSSVPRTPMGSGPSCGISGIGKSVKLLPLLQLARVQWAVI